MKPFIAKPVRAKSIDREGLEQAALLKEVALRYPVAAKLIFTSRTVGTDTSWSRSS